MAVPSNPTFADDDRNIGLIAGLVTLGREGRWPVTASTDGRVALVGFSRGGCEILRVAAKMGRAVHAWVELDPVDRDGKGQKAAPAVRGV